MTPLQKRNINVLVPIVLAAAYVYKFDPKMANYKRTLMVVTVILVVSWLITNQVTSYIIKEQSKPDDGRIPANANDFDEGTFCTRLYNDITCVFCLRDTDLYKQLAALPDAFIVAINSYWNQNYFGKTGQSLRVAINGEQMWTTFYYGKFAWQNVIATINGRFDQLNIQ